MKNDYNTKSHRFIKSLNPIEDCFKFNKGLLGGITDAIGLTDYKGQASAQEAAIASSERSTDKSLEIARENIAFQKEQLEFQRDKYEVWEGTFGDISENLGNYYENLTPDKFVSQGLTNIAKEYSVANKEIQRTLAQRGITGSGIEAAAITASGISEAGAKANIRNTAEDNLAAEKSKFLALGLGQGTAMIGQTVSQASNVGGAFNSATSAQLQGGLNTSNINSAYARTLAGTNASTLNKTIDVGGQIAGGFMSSDKRLKENIKYITTIKGVKLYIWDWNNKAIKLGLTGSSYGVIAQEVQEVYPDLVIKEDKYLKVNYLKLVEVLNA